MNQSVAQKKKETADRQELTGKSVQTSVFTFVYEK